MTQGRCAQVSLDLHAKYGSIVRVAPNQLSVTADEAWVTIYAYNAGTSFPKSAQWFQARPNGAYGLLASPNSEHGRFRRVFAQAFTEKALADRESLIDKHTGDLVRKLAQLSSEGRTVNMTDELEFVSFDIAGDFAYSRSFECLHKPDNRGQIKFVQLGMKVFTARAMKRVMGVNTLSNLLENASTNMQPQKTPYQHALTTWTKTRLEHSAENDKPDLMDHVANSTHKSKTLQANEAENAIGDFMIAGTETVSTTVVAALLNLTNHPELLRQVQRELIADSEAMNELKHSQLAQAPLLNAVVNETMRLAPSVPHALPRTVPALGTHISGHFLPEGVCLEHDACLNLLLTIEQTGVNFNQYAAYRDPNNFSMPTDFKPQRWMDPTSVEVHNSAVFNPFSVGPRNCIGKQWGLRAVRALLAQIVLNFDLERTGNDWAWEDQNTSFVWEKKDLMLNLKLRSL